MNWGQFKDPIFHMCLTGAVVAFWCLTQEFAVFNPFTATTLVTEFSEFNDFIIVTNNYSVYNRHK